MIPNKKLVDMIKSGEKSNSSGSEKTGFVFGRFDLKNKETTVLSTC